MRQLHHRVAYVAVERLRKQLLAIELDRPISESRLRERAGRDLLFVNPEVVGPL